MQQALLVDPEREAADEVGVRDEDAFGAALGHVQLAPRWHTSDPGCEGSSRAGCSGRHPRTGTACCVGSGGSIPKITASPPSSGSTRFRSASCPPQLLQFVELVRVRCGEVPAPGRSRPAGSRAPRGVARPGRTRYPDRSARSSPARSPTGIARDRRQPTSHPCTWRGCRTSSKYCTVCRSTAARHRRTCRGSWCRPSAPARSRRPLVGSGMPAASRMVGPMSMQCVNWVRRSPWALIRSGHATTIGIARAAEVAGDLLAPLERRVAWRGAHAAA